MERPQSSRAGSRGDVDAARCVSSTADGGEGEGRELKPTWHTEQRRLASKLFQAVFSWVTSFAVEVFLLSV